MLLLLAATVFFYAGKATAQTPSKDTSVSFPVAGVCGQCKDRIEDALQMRGVKSADWDVDTKMLHLVYDPSKTDLKKVQTKIASVGHDTPLKKADDMVYESLEACCHYRDPDLNHEAHQNEETGDHDHAAATPSHVANSIMGIVLQEDNKGNFSPLEGASIVWLENGVGTTTNSEGVFTLPKNGERLVVSYTGFQSDTLTVNGSEHLQIVLSDGKQLKAVTVTSRRAALYINTKDPFRTQQITQKELLKAACCNLSESFETNPSVDVSYNDAVTGSKQIQLLGLSGNYTQLTVENLPGPRGLATALGLNSIPGTWIESIQLMKGTGSVVNGFESIAGQINVELKKPATAEKLYANVYVNDQGKTDLNLNLAKILSKKWSTALLLHDAFYNNKSLDFNKDGFRDAPTGNLFSGLNRWNYDDGKGLEAQLGIKLLLDEKTGGEVGFRPADKSSTSVYGLQIDTRRVEGFAKIGYIFPQKKYKSIGLQLSAFDHDQKSYFGLTNYDAHQTNFYSNLIYQSIIGNSNHTFRTGLSLQNDRYDEQFLEENYKRNELVTGGFFEYNFKPNEHFSLVAGLREDYNSIYGWFTTPRLNVRYEPIEGTVIRLSAGRGQRTANIFAENNGALVSSRKVMVETSDSKGAYGLSPEISWNKGISIDQKFRLFNRNANLGVDFFRNDFEDQVVVDMEDPRSLKFYNLEGKSYSNSLQGELNFAPVKNLDVRLAYRYFDVKTTYEGELLNKPFTAKNRAFANLSYSVNKWKIDYTISLTGEKRLPSTAANPPEYQLGDHSPSYTLMNAQISRTLGRQQEWDLYVGGENLTNFYQKKAIIASDDPFGNYFDASMVWGPLSGRMFYLGLRYKLK